MTSQHAQGAKVVVEQFDDGTFKVVGVATDVSRTTQRAARWARWQVVDASPAVAAALRSPPPGARLAVDVIDGVAHPAVPSPPASRRRPPRPRYPLIGTRAPTPSTLARTLAVLLLVLVTGVQIAEARPAPPPPEPDPFALIACSLYCERHYDICLDDAAEPLAAEVEALGFWPALAAYSERARVCLGALEACHEWCEDPRSIYVSIPCRRGVSIPFHGVWRLGVGASAVSATCERQTS